MKTPVSCWLCGQTSHENSSCPLSIENLIKNSKSETKIKRISSNDQAEKIRICCPKSN